MAVSAVMFFMTLAWFLTWMSWGFLWMFFVWEVSTLAMVEVARLIALTITCAMYEDTPRFKEWLQAGGDPLFDTLTAFGINDAPPTVSMAIGKPPTCSQCVCGEPLGKKFGNECGKCGRLWDNF